MAKLGKLRFNWRGVWVSGNSYEEDDMVYYNGATYICNANTSSTTSPQDRLGTNTDDPGVVGTDWTLYSHGGFGGNANAGQEGYVSANTFVYGANSYSHAYITNSWWRAGTYYYGDSAQFLANTGVIGTYRVKTTSTTLPPANTTVNPTSDWDRIAFGSTDNAKTALVHPKCASPFPNAGYVLRDDWAGETFSGNSANIWYGDTYGYAINNECNNYDRAYFVNKNYGLVRTPGMAGTGLPSSPFRGNASNVFRTSEIPFRHLDWIDGVLPTPDGEPPKLTQVLQHYSGVLVLFNNGEVHYEGLNAAGEAGRGSTGNDNEGVFNRWGYSQVNSGDETTVLRGKKAIRIAMSLGTASAATHSTYALIDNGDNTTTVYACGENAHGQLGQGDTTDLSVPTAITFDAATHGKIVDIWSSGGVTGRLWVLTDQAKMFACGDNLYGTLGVGDTTDKNTLTLVKDWGPEGGIRKFSSGGNHTYGHCGVVTNNGKLWTWGRTDHGQLGNGSTASSQETSPIQIGTNTDWINVWCMGYNNTAFTFGTRGTSEFVNDLYHMGGSPDYIGGLGSTTENLTVGGGQPLDSYGNTISNIINVATMVGYVGNFGSVGLEQYIGPTHFENQNGYKTRWYHQGENIEGTFGRAQNNENFTQQDLPSASTNATAKYYYHQNLYVPADINPYRICYYQFGYQTALMLLVVDKDLGRVYFTGDGDYGLNTSSNVNALATASAGQTAASYVPLPYL